jgi:surface polysaccharide O-acyltransferase-like enzyme
MRGIAIIFVVYLHVYFSAWGGVPGREVLVLHAIHLFAHGAVPVFLFVSGLLLARSRPTSMVDFATRKLRRIYIPLVFWMFVALAYSMATEGGLSMTLVRSMLAFGISGQYYYLVVLLVLMVAFFLVAKAPWGGSARIPVAAFMVNLATIVYYQHSTVAGNFAVVAYRNPFVWVFFFSFGFYAGRRWRDLAWTETLLLPTAAAMVAIGAYYFWSGQTGEYPVSYFGVQVFLFSTCAIVFYTALIRRLARSRIGRWLIEPFRRLSRYSFAIYLAHKPLFVVWLAGELVSNGRYSHDYLQLMTALFVVGFTTTLVFVLAIEKISPWFAATLVGIEPPAEAATPVASQ